MNSLKLGWLSDIHLNFLNDEELDEFIDSLTKFECDAYMISGDLTEAPYLKDHLIRLASTGKKIFFVCGNHDYWHSSFAKIREMLLTLGENIIWLGRSDIIELTPESCLIGCDGWYDGGYGDWRTSSIFMNDWNRITEFKQAAAMNRLDEIMRICRELASEDAKKAVEKIEKAFVKYDNCYFVTHVPPWPAIAVYRGQPTQGPALPFYTNRSMGNLLDDVMSKHPNKKLLSFSGHTHFSAHAEIAHNIIASNAHADYGNPGLMGVIEVK